MSTDYGFGCKTCGVDDDGRVLESEIIENFRDPMALKKWLAIQADVLKQITDAGLRVTMEYGDLYRIGDAFAFVADHRNRGHEVGVCDEYRRWVDACDKDVRCECCGSQRRCSLRDDHEPPCVARTK